VKHEPRSFLSDADGPVNLIRGDAILAVHQHPNGHVPLAKADRRILENRADAHGELFLAGLAAPNLPRRVETGLLRTAQWALNSIRPATRYGPLKGIIGVREEHNGFLKGTRNIDTVRSRNGLFSL